MPDFDPKAYIAANADLVKGSGGSDFDPKAYLAANSPKPKPEVGESLLRGAAQGASFGFADELTAVVGAAKDSLTSPVDFSTAYKSWKKVIRKADAEAKDANPVSFGAGQIAGGIASVAAPGMGLLNAAKGATTAARVGKAASVGGLMGAGASEADMTDGPHGAVQLAKDIGAGAAVGAVTQYGLDKAGPILASKLKGLPGAVKRSAERWAFKSGAATQGKIYREAATKGNLQAVGRDMLDDGIVTFGSNARTITEKAGAAKSATGKKIGELLSQIDEQVPDSVDATKIAENIAEYAKSIEAPNNTALIENLNKQASEFWQKGRISLTEANRLKRLYKWDPREPSSMSLGKEAANKLNRLISDSMDEAVDSVTKGAASQSGKVAETAETALVSQVGGKPVGVVAQSGDDVMQAIEQAAPQLGQAEKTALATTMKTQVQPPAPTGAPVNSGAIYRALKRKYGSAATAEKSSKELANRLDKNRFFSLTDYMAGGIGLAGSGGNPVTAFALAQGNKVMRERGPASVAVTLDKVADLLAKSPNALGDAGKALTEAAKRGSLLSTHAYLLSRDKGYSKYIETIEKMDAMERRMKGTN